MVSPGRTARMSPTATASSGTSSSCPSRTRRAVGGASLRDRKSTRLNSSHGYISYAVFCLKKKICGLEPIEVLVNRATVDGRPGERHGAGVAYDGSDLDIRTVSMDPATGETGLRRVTHVSR